MKVPPLRFLNQQKRIEMHSANPTTYPNPNPHASLTPLVTFRPPRKTRCKEVQEESTVDGVGEIPAKPLIEVCVAYTCIKEDEDDNAYTGRKIKVSCREMPLAAESEEIFDSLDPEALAVPLFHKLCLNALQGGLEEAQET
jgi:hypothetical protein